MQPPRDAFRNERHLMKARSLQFGINVNNREPLIAPEYYSLSDLLDVSQMVEQSGFDSIWVGDSLFSKPRYEPLLLLAAIAQRTQSAKLGTACLVTGTRNPLYLSLEWSTLDHISGGRTILGACMGNPEEGVEREYEALGLEFKNRAAIFEEGLAILRQLWTEGRADFKGEHFHYDNVSFYSGTEQGPLMPIQKPPPIWVVSNPRLVVGTREEDRVEKVISRAARRIAELGDGWMTCCRARHPDEFSQQRQQILAAADGLGRDRNEYVMSYQVTMNIADSQEAAQKGIGDYINEYYPELSKKMDLGEWGPVGTPDDIISWIREFAEAGTDHFICRFGSLDQIGQIKRFTRDVLPAFRG